MEKMKKAKIMLLAATMVCTMTMRTFAASCPSDEQKKQSNNNNVSCNLQVKDISNYRNMFNYKSGNLYDLYKALNKKMPSLISKYQNNFNCNNEYIRFKCNFSEIKMPVADEPIVDGPVEEKPIVEEPVAETPIVEVPVEETPIVEEAKPAPGTNLTEAQYIAEVARLVNVERAKAGLGELTVDSKIAAAAYVRSTEQQQQFSHTRPNGTSCFTVLAEQGVTYRGAGENIAMGQKTPAEVMNAWMNSPGHKANILNKNFTKIGVGYYKSNGTAYWTQLFTY